MTQLRYIISSPRLLVLSLIIILGLGAASYGALLYFDPFQRYPHVADVTAHQPAASSSSPNHSITPPSADPSLASMPTTTPSGWQQVYADNFGGPLSKNWTAYNGQYGDSAHSQAKSTHVYTKNNSLHISGRIDRSDPDNPSWYNGGACLCHKSSDNASWIDSKDVMVSFRWRAVTTKLTSEVPPKYAFLRWPESEQWPSDGEEDFLEGYLQPSTGYEFTSHAATAEGKDHNAYWHRNETYDPSDWHTVTYQRKNYSMQLIIDGQKDVNYQGSETSAPYTKKHLVFQQVCDRLTSCPTSGVSDIQIDWIVVYQPE